MQRLRHPVRAIREPFGKAGLTVAILALVFAMVGGAWAAVGLNSKQKKEVTKIAKKYAGKPGPAGAAGTNGTNGTNGAKGDTGAAGSAGTSGTSVTTSAATTTPAGECPTVGGTKFTSASPASHVCNGSPWTAGGTLPSNSTETGTFLISAPTGAPTFGSEGVAGSISFNIPLAEELNTANVKYIAAAGAIPGECENTEHGGTASAQNPEADPGYLCVFEVAQTNDEFFSGEMIAKDTVHGFGAGKAGAFVIAYPQIVANKVSANGTWAVTAP